jgi:hypothetical protein
VRRTRYREGAEIVQKLESQRRPLTTEEERYVRALSSRNRWIVFCVLVFVLLGLSLFYWVAVAVLAIFFGDALFQWGMLGWLGLFGLMSVLIVGTYVTAGSLTGYTADVYEVRANGLVLFDKLKDEGPYYAFGLEDGRIVFVMGQEFDDAENFPCLHFTGIDIRDDDNSVIGSLVQCHGPKVEPTRSIPGEVKTNFVMPDRFEVRLGNLENVESLLERVRTTDALAGTA